MTDKFQELMNRPLTFGALRILIAIISSTALIVFTGAMSFNRVMNSFEAVNKRLDMRDTIDVFSKRDIYRMVNQNTEDIKVIKQDIISINNKNTPK